MKVLGRTTEPDAQKFVKENKAARLGSMAGDGTRRIVTDATGDAFNAVRELFQKIVVASPASEKNAQVSSAPLPCILRGSQRKTCCGSPDLWICRERKTDCVSTHADAKRLQGMVLTQEAASIAICETCELRTEQADLELIAQWPPIKSRTDTTIRVGFLSAAYMPIGGTETFHQGLLPRLKTFVDVAGFVSTGFHGGDGAKLKVPYSTGVRAAQQLARHCDVIIAWGIHDLSKLLPAKRPKVIAVHHSDYSSDWNNRAILNQLDMIDEAICVNRDTAAKLATCGKPVHYVPNAIDPERIRPSGQQSALRALHSIPAESKIVLFGHRLSSEKRPHLAVRIARQLPDDWMMVIAGDGPERDAVEAAKCDRVRIVGVVESLADWLSVSDCFLSLSTFEGFGLAIGEAMAAGVPTVSTPAGIAPGLATTLPTDSTAEQWAAAIVTATQLVKPEVILERFSVDRMVDAWAEILKAPS